MVGCGVPETTPNLSSLCPLYSVISVAVQYWKKGVGLGSAKSSWAPSTILPNIYLSPSFLAEPGVTCPPLAYFTIKIALGADKYSELSPLSSQPGVNVCALGGTSFRFSVAVEEHAIARLFPGLARKRLVFW